MILTASAQRVKICHTAGFFGLGLEDQEKDAHEE
jgi:hypothetical protein